MQVFIDGRKITDKATLHAYLKEQCKFPDYYGNNLDALYDVLTDRTEPLEICLEYASELKEKLCGYGEAFIATLEDAAAGCDYFKFKMIDEFISNLADSIYSGSDSGDESCVLWEDKLTCDSIPKIRDEEFEEYLVEEETVFLNCRIKKLTIYAETSLRDCIIDELIIKDGIVNLRAGNCLGVVSGGPVMIDGVINDKINEIDELKDAYVSNTNAWRLPIRKISGKSTVIKGFEDGGYVYFCSNGDGTFGIIYGRDQNGEEEHISFSVVCEGFPPKSYSYDYDESDILFQMLFAGGEYPDEEMQEYFRDIAEELEIEVYGEE